MIRKIKRFFFQAADPIKIDTYRFFIGFTVCYFMVGNFRHASEWLTAAGFHPSAGNLPYHPLYAPLLPEGMVFWFGLLLFGSIGAVIIGWQLRLALWLLLFCTAYVTLADQLMAYTTNKIMVVSLLILSLSGGGKYYCCFGRSKKDISIWPVRILQIAFVLQVFLAGFSKAYYGPWVSDPDCLWRIMQGLFQTEFAVWMYQNIPKPLWTILQWSVLVFELSAPILFFYKPTRRYACVFAFAFFLMIALSMRRIDSFAFFMTGYLVLFISDKTLLRCYNSIKNNLPVKI